MSEKIKKKNDLPESAPIGVFDSGIGGLTVLDSLMRCFPQENFIYLGDTARLPYGTKSPATVIRYAESLARVLLTHNVKALVVACSTASSHALPAVQELAGSIPVIGMIEPTSRAAIAATRNKHIGVMATAGTIRSKIYETTLHTLADNLLVSPMACQMLVALAEEGWVQDGIARATLEKYLNPVFDAPDAPDTLILGCTHFPLFIPLLQDILGNGVTLINSGEAASQALSALLPQHENPDPQLSFYATDDPVRFAQGAARFFGHDVAAEDVRLIDIG